MGGFETANSSGNQRSGSSARGFIVLVRKGCNDEVLSERL